MLATSCVTSGVPILSQIGVSIANISLGEDYATYKSGRPSCGASPGLRYASMSAWIMSVMFASSSLSSPGTSQIEI